MAKDINNFEQIREEITEMVDAVRAADRKQEEEENQIRSAYEAAQKEMTAALKTGSMNKYKAAGLEAEGRRLELEFFEKRKARGLEPCASVDDEKRIRTALYREYNAIRIDTFAQLESLQNEVKDVAADALQKIADIDKLFTLFETVVMRKHGNAHISNNEIRIAIESRMNAAKTALNTFQYFSKDD